MDDSKMVTITQEEYDDLLQTQKWVYCLEAAGVDNWEGYDIAKDMLRDEE